MGTDTIPCEDCDRVSAEFRAAGFTVHGCTPHPSLAEMCVLSFTPPGVAAAVGGGAPVAAAAGPAPGQPAAPAGAAPALLAPTQVRTAQAIVNIFETGAVLGDYGQVTAVDDDPGLLTYGRSQTTLASGLLAELLRRYADNPGARFGVRMRPWLPQLQPDNRGLNQALRLHNLLRACADDPLMRETQDAFFDENFWQPAQRAANRLGLGSALAVAVVYDSHVHGSWRLIQKRTDAAVGTVAAVGERRWIAAYVAQRRSWLALHPNALLRKTVYRMEAFQRLIDLGAWGLPLPLVVRGHEISAATLSALPPGCYDGPPPGSRSLSAASPLPRGLDVRLVQLALSDAGAAIRADGVYGEASAKSVRTAQAARGLPPTGVADPAFIAQLLA